MRCRRTPVAAAPLEKLISDDDRSADIHAAEEVENVLVMHSDTAVAREAADGARAVGAVNCIFAAARGRYDHCEASRRDELVYGDWLHDIEVNAVRPTCS